MKLLDDGTLLECKSTPDNYTAEKMNCLTQGSKRNTVRFVNFIEHLAITEAKMSGTLTHIRIVNTETGEHFLRKLTDFRPFQNDNIVDGMILWIFSW